MEKSKLFRRAKGKRILYHKTSFTTNGKGTRNTREEKRNTREQNRPQTIKKMAIGAHMSIIILNINGLNVPTKKPRLAKWIHKQDLGVGARS